MMGTHNQTLCVECGNESIARCPSCKKPVHHGFGLQNLNCSGKHEATCAGARDSRLAVIVERMDAKLQECDRWVLALTELGFTVRMDKSPKENLHEFGDWWARQKSSGN